MTDKRIKELLRNMQIICDTRENENLHITDYFDKYGIKYVEQKLDFGDYSFIAPPIPEIRFNEPASFENRIVIERKSGLTELSGNLAQQRERFEAELIRAKNKKAKLILMVEDGSYEKIMRHDYRTDFNERSYIASLFSFQARYEIEVQFIPAKLAGWFIFNTFYYYFRNELKQLEAVL